MQQASGEQVQEAFEGSKYLISTNFEDSNDAAWQFHGCSILFSNFTGKEATSHIVLGVTVQQVVKIAAPASSAELSPLQVTRLVERGFRKRTGGSFALRERLNTYPAFSSLSSIALLDGGWPASTPSTPPTQEPTTSPSLQPTRQPIAVASPRLVETNNPTLQPTKQVTLQPVTTKTVAPTLDPTTAPSISPLSAMSEVPSETPHVVQSEVPSGPPHRSHSDVPSTIPTVVDFSFRPALETAKPGSDKPVQLLSQSPSQYSNTPSLSPMKAKTLPPQRRPSTVLTVQDETSPSKIGLILGALLGGFAMVGVSLFFCYCVYPFCCQDKTDNSQSTMSGSGSPSFGSPQYVVSGPPSPVQPLGDDKSDSGTAFRITSLQRDGIQSHDSFDDCSLFTSTTSIINGIGRQSGTVVKPIRYTSDRAVGPVDLHEIEDVQGSGANPYPFFGIQKTMPSEVLDASDSVSIESWNQERLKQRDFLEVQGESNEQSLFGINDAFSRSQDSISSNRNLGNEGSESGQSATVSSHNDTNRLLRKVLQGASRAMLKETRSVTSFKSAPDRRYKHSTTGHESQSTSISREARSVTSLISAPGREAKRITSNGLPKTSSPGNKEGAKGLLTEHLELEKAISNASGRVKGQSKSVGWKPSRPGQHKLALRTLENKSISHQANTKASTCMREATRSEEWSVLSDDRRDDSPLSTPATSPGILGISGRTEEASTIGESSTSSEFSRRNITSAADSFSAMSSYLSGYSAGTSNQSKSVTGLERFFMQELASQQSSTEPVIDGSADEPRVKSTRSLETDLKHLEGQLARVLSRDGTASSITTPSFDGSRRSSHMYKTLEVPPGKLGIVLASWNDGTGSTVSTIKAGSSMSGLLEPGDKIGMLEEYLYVHELTSSQLQLTTKM